jgi:hypothetical protein
MESCRDSLLPIREKRSETASQTPVRLPRKTAYYCGRTLSAHVSAPSQALKHVRNTDGNGQAKTSSHGCICTTGIAGLGRAFPLRVLSALLPDLICIAAAEGAGCRRG